MEEKGEECPQLLDLMIPKDREWLLKRDKQRSHESSTKEEIKNLELRLGPPGEEKNSREREDSTLSHGYYSNKMTHFSSGAKRGFTDTVDLRITGEKKGGWIINFNESSSQQQQQQQQQQQTYLQMQSKNQQKILPVMGKESSQPCSTRVVELQQTAEEKKGFSAAAAASANTAVLPNSSQKRTAPAPLVGWPPVRSCRKNLASSSSSKQTPEVENEVQNKSPVEKPVASCRKGFFVKINMDGVAIGRKVDLEAYDSYEKLASSVDELFRGLLAAQRDSSAGGGIQSNQEGDKAITGLLDGSGEYTLVYEDNEGDRILVGDVPWHMFISSVKRLRVLKSSELSTLCLGSKREKIPVYDAASR